MSRPHTHVFFHLPTGRRSDPGPASLQLKPATAPELKYPPTRAAPIKRPRVDKQSSRVAHRFECNPISQSVLVWEGGGGNLTALSGSKAEL